MTFKGFNEKKQKRERFKNSQIKGAPWWLSGKESACQCGRRMFDPWVGKIPQRRKWQATAVFLPAKSHGQRNLEG